MKVIVCLVLLFCWPANACLLPVIFLLLFSLLQDIDALFLLFDHYGTERILRSYYAKFYALVLLFEFEIRHMD
jgi:uncharacterized membrane protein YbhN (UPF0104 family)